MVTRPTRNKFFSDLSAQIGLAIINFLILKAIMGIAGTFTGPSEVKGAVDYGAGFAGIGANTAGRELAVTCHGKLNTMSTNSRTRALPRPPGHRMMTAAPAEVPMMAQLLPRGDGTFTLKPRLPDAHGESWIPTREAKRISGQSDSTLYRWSEAGLIQARRPTATKWEFELRSLLAHLEAIKDPEFWERHRQAGEFLKSCRR